MHLKEEEVVDFKTPSDTYRINMDLVLSTPSGNDDYVLYMNNQTQQVDSMRKVNSLTPSQEWGYAKYTKKGKTPFGFVVTSNLWSMNDPTTRGSLLLMANQAFDNNPDQIKVVFIRDKEGLTYFIDSKERSKVYHESGKLVYIKEESNNHGQDVTLSRSEKLIADQLSEQVVGPGSNAKRDRVIMETATWLFDSYRDAIMEGREQDARNLRVRIENYAAKFEYRHGLTPSMLQEMFNRYPKQIDKK